MNFLTSGNIGYWKFIQNLVINFQHTCMKKHSLTVVCFDEDCFFGLQNMKAKCGLTNINESLDVYGATSTHFIPFNKEGFVKLCNRKFTALSSYIANCGPVYYADPDVVFFKDPEQECLKYSDSDIVFQSDTKNNPYGSYQCAGNLFVNNTPASVKFLKRVEALLALSPDVADQIAIMNIFRGAGCRDIRTFKDAKLEVFDPRLVQNGYNAFRRQWHTNPDKICVHANYLVGESAKIAALRKCNGWFLP